MRTATWHILLFLCIPLLGCRPETSPATPATAAASHWLGWSQKAARFETASRERRSWAFSVSRSHELIMTSAATALADAATSGCPAPGSATTTIASSGCRADSGIRYSGSLAINADSGGAYSLEFEEFAMEYRGHLRHFHGLSKYEHTPTAGWTHSMVIHLDDLGIGIRLALLDHGGTPTFVPGSFAVVDQLGRFEIDGVESPQSGAPTLLLRGADQMQARPDGRCYTLTVGDQIRERVCPEFLDERSPFPKPENANRPMALSR